MEIGKFLIEQSFKLTKQALLAEKNNYYKILKLCTSSDILFIFIQQAITEKTNIEKLLNFSLSACKNIGIRTDLQINGAILKITISKDVFEIKIPESEQEKINSVVEKIKNKAARNSSFLFKAPVQIKTEFNLPDDRHIALSKKN